MYRFLLILLLSIPSIGTARNAEFHALMESYHQSPKALLASAVYAYEYVFVAGFLNEGLLGYFKDNKDLLKEVGVSEKQIHVLKPSSRKGVIENAAELSKALSKIHAKSGRQLVIIAHSKGALESLAVAVINPPLINKAVKKLFLVQGALKGSAVADYMSGVGPAAGSEMPFKERAWFLITGRTAKALDPIINQGMGALTHEYTSQLWNSLFTRFGKPSKSVSDKISYVTSYDQTSLMAEVIDCTGTYIATYFGKNDGLVTLEDQSFDEFGSVLATINADHADLFTPRPISNTNSIARRAFTFGLLKTL